MANFAQFCQEPAEPSYLNFAQSMGIRYANQAKTRPLGTVVAHFLGKEEVVSSILTGGSKVREKSRTYAGVAQPGRASGS